MTTTTTTTPLLPASCHRLCTCTAPPRFNLTDFLLQRILSLQDETKKNNIQIDNDDDTVDDDDGDDDNDTTTLSSIFQRHGWTVVDIEMTMTSDDNNSNKTLLTKRLLQLYPQLFPMMSTTNNNNNENSLSDWNQHWKKLLHELFQSSSSIQEQDNPEHGIYRQAESGSAQEGIVEPKESWEVQRKYCQNKQNNQTKNTKNTHQHPLYDFMEVMHQIAISVRTALDLPPNVLLLQDDDNKNDKKNNNRHRKHDEPLDLMRAFYYHTVPMNHQDDDNSKNNNITLGSSEHTDWGSFTVVWQDDTGGLETFCHACQQWNPVNPTWKSSYNKNENDKQDNQQKDKDNNSRTISFVVHLSDVTSLAMGLTSKDRENDNGMILRSESLPSVLSQTWPSPRHRVVSPTQQPRASLVYFAYPPPSLSIADIAKALCLSSKQTKSTEALRSHEDKEYHQIPLNDYFLLRNQAEERTSSKGDASELQNEQNLQRIKNNAARRQLSQVLHRPVQDVMMDKWFQVQRTSY